MYQSVVQEGKFLVVIADGIGSLPIMELPTEELADKVAYELQKAWDEGLEYGESRKWKELDKEGFDKTTSESIKKLKNLPPEQREAYSQRLERRHQRKEKIKEIRRWQSVLGWKCVERGQSEKGIQ